MRRTRLVIVGALAILAAASGQAQAGHSVPIVIFTPAAPPPGPYVPSGDRAAMPLEMTDTPVAQVHGVMKHGDIIAQHIVRSVEAVVLTEAAKGSFGNIPAGTVLARVNVDQGPNDARVWCDLHPRVDLLFRRGFECLEDTAASGHFDRRWVGDSASRFFGPSLSGATRKDVLPEPATYRAARPDERPTARIGYRFCDGDGVTGPPRFAFVIAPLGEGWPLAVFDHCTFGTWPDPGNRATVDLAGIKLTLGPSRQDGLAYEVEGRIPEGLLSALDQDRPVEAQGAAPSPAAVERSHDAAMAQPALVPTGALPVVTAGAIVTGQTFLTVAVRHGITGILRDTVSVRGRIFSPDDTLPVGQPMFGVPMSGTVETDIIWCAPRPRRGGGWATVCFPRDALKRHHWVGDAAPALMPMRLVWQMTTPYASSAPAVDAGPATLPSMNLGLKLTAVQPARPGVSPAKTTYVIAIVLDWGQGAQTLREVKLPLGQGQSATLRILGGVLLLSRGSGPDQINVTVVQPLSGAGALLL